MCAFYHKPDEKLKVEHESESFYDPLLEDYEDEGYEQEYEGECDSEDKSPKSSQSNTNTNTNYITQESGENDSATKPESKFPLTSDENIVFDEVSEANVWANAEFGLEAALQKTHSQTQKEDFEAIATEPDSSRLLKTSSKEITVAKKTPSPKLKEEVVRTKVDELVSTEIKNIVLGNTQQMTTAKIVENIVAQAPSTSKSKFFDFIEDNKENEEDCINDILSMDYKTFLMKNETKSKSPNPSANHPYQDINSLYVIQEEGESADSN